MRGHDPATSRGVTAQVDLRDDERTSLIGMFKALPTCKPPKHQASPLPHRRYLIKS